MGQPKRIAFMLELEWIYKRHAGIFAGTQEYARSQMWHSIIDEFAGHSLESGVSYDGIIARADEHLLEQASQRGVPVVNVWFSSPVAEELPGVFVDFKAAGTMRANLLLTRGFRRFATLTDRKNSAHDLEVEAFQEVVMAAGFTNQEQKISLDRTSSYAQWKKIEKQITDWMERFELPIGIFVGSEDAARIVVQMCNVRGWRVPEDVAIIGGANEESLCVNPRPSLSSLEMGFERVGYEAARMLDELMVENASRQASGQDAKDVQHLFLQPTGLILRESTDFFAVEDNLVARSLEFIAANSHKAIGPDDVATAVAMHPRTLQRRFTQCLGRPIAAEIRRVRLERAKRELAQSGESLSKIAATVGFIKPERMYQVFVRELGVTPSEYRNQRVSSAMR